MWNAIKNDLFDFVSTIKEDTTKTVNKAIGASDSEEDEKSAVEQAISDIRRSFATFNSPVDAQFVKEFDKFTKTFSLSSYNVDIAELLDLEPDISRYYAELVPSQITPEIFWARYFFKIKILTSGSSLSGLEDDDEEELTWENDAEAAAPAESERTEVKETAAASLKSAGASENFNTDTSSVDNAEEMKRLQGNVRTLTRRVAELEQQLADKDKALAAVLQQLTAYNSVVPAVINAAASCGVPVSPQASSSATVSQSSMAAPVVHRDDSLSSFSESECSDGSSIVLVPQLAAVKPTVASVPSRPAKESRVVALDESDDDDGGWT